MNQFEKRKQKLNELCEKVFDVIVVGGGITGAGIVRDATFRGLDTLILDKGDFASGTSSKSGKLVHGGLRYLKSFQISLVFESCLERFRLMKIVAPHLVKPTMFMLPFYKDSKTPRWLVAIGLFLYDLLSLFRNISTFKFESIETLKENYPGLKTEGLIGGLSYYDCKVLDYRLTVETIKSASLAGAHALNYLEVVGIDFSETPIKVSVVDRVAGGSWVLKCSSVINASGAWADKVIELGALGAKEKFNLGLTSGIHIFVSKLKFPIKKTISVEAIQDKRPLYAVPWGEYVLIGTTDKYYKEDLGHQKINRADVTYLLDNLKHYFPGRPITKEDIVFISSGVRPLIGSSDGLSESEVSRDFEIRYSSAGMLSVTGGKLTTYRHMAKMVVNELISKKFSDKQQLDLPTLSPLIPKNTEDESISEDSKKLFDTYGSEARSILKIWENDSAKKEEIYLGAELSFGELDYFLDHEFAQSISDIFLRRSELAQLAHPLEDNEWEKIVEYLSAYSGLGSEYWHQSVKDYLSEINQNMEILRN